MFSLNKIFQKIIAFVKIFGFAAFEFPSNEFKVSKFGVIFCILNIFLNFFNAYNFLVITSFINNFSNHDKTSIIHLSLVIAVLFSYIGNFLCLITCIVFKKGIFETFKKLVDFDDEVRISFTSFQGPTTNQVLGVKPCKFILKIKFFFSVKIDGNFILYKSSQRVLFTNCPMGI